MFFIDHYDEAKKLFAITDTDDCVINYITQEEYNNYIRRGIMILDWASFKEHLDQQMINKSNIKLLRKLYRGMNTAELNQYFRNNTVYPITGIANTCMTYIDPEKDIILYPYNETLGFYIFKIHLKDNSLLIVKLNLNGSMQLDRITGGYDTKLNPTASGYAYSMWFKKANLGFHEINTDHLYMLLFGNTTMLYNLTTMKSSDAVINKRVDNIGV